VGYYNIIITVPITIQDAPIAVFKLKVSPRKITENIMVSAKLNLSTGATCEIFPISNALKYNIQDKPVVMPEKIRKAQFCFVSEVIVLIPPLKNTMAQAKTTTTIVLIAIARLVSIFLIPTFAKMPVSAAKRADNNAKIHHIVLSFILIGTICP
jgi:hypothetical protein